MNFVDYRLKHFKLPTQEKWFSLVYVVQLLFVMRSKKSPNLSYKILHYSTVALESVDWTILCLKYASLIFYN